MFGFLFRLFFIAEIGEEYERGISRDKSAEASAVEI